jgi:hypothetical protein
MALPPQSLTVAGGGMSRLRTKGAALKSTLYQLTNGYVTAAQTVKVRPGTFRTANLGAYGIAGVSKGLVAYKDSMHIFSHVAGSVPDGFTLHVLNHPAATTTSPASLTDYFITKGTFNAPPATVQVGGNTQAGIIRAGGVGEVPGAGFALAALTTSGFATHGSIAATTVSGAAIEAIFYTASDSIDDPSTLYVVMNTTYDYSSPRAFVYTKQGGGTNTVSIEAGNLTSVLETGKLEFAWDVSGALPDFSATSPLVQFGGGGDIIPIPLKEIHFAAPYMGFLYVVAEFDVDSNTEAEWGSTYHYWLRNVGEWTADTVYTIGDLIEPTTPNGFTYRAARISAPNPAWSAQTLHAVDDVIEPTVANGYFFTAIETDGANPVSGTVEPTWPTTTDATVAEDSETANNDVTAAAPASQTQAPPATGTKYTNPYKGI